MRLLYVFIACFTFGVLYAVFSAVFGGHGGGDHAGGPDHGGGGFDHSVTGHVPGGPHAAGASHVSGASHASGMQGTPDTAHTAHAGDRQSHAGENAESPSPFNPLVIASAIATFGAVGIIGKAGFRYGDLLSTVISLGFAGAIGAVVFFCVVKLIYGSQSDSTFSQYDLPGEEAEVLVPVSGSAVGEIACMLGGVRYTLSARSSGGEAIAKGEKVVIRSVEGNVALVSRKVTVYDLDKA